MQWSLIAVVLKVSALFGASCASTENGKGQISTVFEAFGYSPACVASALTSCEYSSKKELSVDVVDSIEVTKSLLQEMKSETKAIRQEMKSEIKAIRQEMKSAEDNSSSVVKSLLQEMKSERENSASVVKTILQEMKSEIKAIRQEKSAEDNSSSVVKSLLQEMKSERENSASVIKTLLQEMKSDREILESEIKSIRQDIKSERVNSSSVVKSLLQEMKSEMKVILQEAKQYLENVTDNCQSRDCAIPGGTTATPDEKELPKNCAELKEQGETSSGVQTVYPYGSLNPKPTTVYCDQVTDGGGWTVIQSRSPLPIRENFQRNWDEYVEGFGDLKGEFWLGLDNIHALTNSAKMLLRIDLEAADGEKAFALYSTFHVGDAASEYVLRIGGYSGTAGDGMTHPSDNRYNLNNMQFSTHDNDNDLWESNCAVKYKGGWWFKQCGSAAHLNGLPIVGSAPNGDGITWFLFRGWNQSMKKATMKLRPVSLGF